LNKDQSGIDHQAVGVQGDADAAGAMAWQHLLGAPFSGVGLALQTVIPDAQEHLLTASEPWPDALHRWIQVPPATKSSPVE